MIVVPDTNVLDICLPHCVLCSLCGCSCVRVGPRANVLDICPPHHALLALHGRSCVMVGLATHECPRHSPTTSCTACHSGHSCVRGGATHECPGHSPTTSCTVQPSWVLNGSPPTPSSSFIYCAKYVKSGVPWSRNITKYGHSYHIGNPRRQPSGLSVGSKSTLGSLSTPHNPGDITQDFLSRHPRNIPRISDMS